MNIGISENHDNNTPDLDNNQDCKNSVIMLNTSNAKVLGLSEEEIAELGLESELSMMMKLMVSRIVKRLPFTN